jgi:hypothetical protein
MSLSYPMKWKIQEKISWRNYDFQPKNKFLMNKIKQLKDKILRKYNLKHKDQNTTGIWKNIQKSLSPFKKIKPSVKLSLWQKFKFLRRKTWILKKIRFIWILIRLNRVKMTLVRENFANEWLTLKKSQKAREFWMLSLLTNIERAKIWKTE